MNVENETALSGEAEALNKLNLRLVARARKLKLSSITQIGAKCVGLGMSVITVPLTLKYLGHDTYAIWLMMNSFVTMLVWADLGLSNGMVNIVASAEGRNDKTTARKSVSTGLFMLMGMSVILAVPSFLVVFRADWARAFNVPGGQINGDVLAALGILAAAFLIGLPLSAIEKIRAAKQELYINALFQMGGNILTVVALFAVMLRGGSLPWLVAALVLPGHLASIANGSWFFLKYPVLRPSFGLFDAAVAKKMINVGIHFFGLQLLGVLTFQGDNFIATHLFGLDSVTSLSLHSRLFGIIQMLMTVATLPLWGAYSEAMARGEFDWVRRQFWRSMAFNLGIGGAACLALTVGGPLLLDVWLHHRIVPSVSLLAALALWTLLQCVGNAIGMLLNGANYVRFELIIAGVLALIAMPLKIILAKQFGLIGIPLAGSAAYLVAILLPCVFVVPRILKNLSERTA
jgi:O-antigen/teichoic acid export membrane protein